MSCGALLRRRGTFQAALLPLLLLAPPPPAIALSCDASCLYEHQAASLLQDRGERSRQPLPPLEREDWPHASPSTAGFSALTIIHDPDDPGNDDVVIASAGDMVIARPGEELGAPEAPGEKPTYVVIVPRFDHPRTPRVLPTTAVYGDDSGTGWWLTQGYSLREALTFFEYFLMFLFVVWGIRHLTHKHVHRPPPPDPHFGEDSFSVRSDLAFSRNPPPPVPPGEYRQPPPSAPRDADPAMMRPSATHQRSPPSEPASLRAPVPSVTYHRSPPSEPASLRAPVLRPAQRQLVETILVPSTPALLAWPQSPPSSPPSEPASLRAPVWPPTAGPARRHLVETMLVPPPPPLLAWPQARPLEPRPPRSMDVVVHKATRSLSPPRLVRTTTVARSLSPPRWLLSQPHRLVLRSFDAPPPTVPHAAPQQLSPHVLLRPPAPPLEASVAMEPVLEPMAHS